MRYKCIYSSIKLYGHEVDRLTDRPTGRPTDLVFDRCVPCVCTHRPSSRLLLGPRRRREPRWAGRCMGRAHRSPRAWCAMTVGAWSVPVRVCVVAPADAPADESDAAAAFAFFGGVFGCGRCCCCAAAAASTVLIAALNCRRALFHVPHSFSPPHAFHACLKASRVPPLLRPIAIALTSISFMLTMV